MERPLPRPRPQLLAERRRLRAPRLDRARSASAGSRPPRRIGEHLQHASAARSRASTSSPRTTASRCATSSRTTSSTTSATASTTATAPTPTGRSTTAPRARRTTRGSSPHAARRCATCSGTLLLSAGIPMLTAGDEFGRSQRGNNNAYCHDSALTWLSWDHAPWQQDLLAHVRRLIRLRAREPRAAARSASRGSTSTPRRRPSWTGTTSTARRCRSTAGRIRRTARCSTSRHRPPKSRRLQPDPARSSTATSARST